MAQKPEKLFSVLMPEQIWGEVHHVCYKRDLSGLGEVVRRLLAHVKSGGPLFDAVLESYPRLRDLGSAGRFPRWRRVATVLPRADIADIRRVAQETGCRRSHVLGVIFTALAGQIDAIITGSLTPATQGDPHVSRETETHQRQSRPMVQGLELADLPAEDR